MTTQKHILVREEAKKQGIDYRTYISTFEEGLYKIADWATNNYSTRIANNGKERRFSNPSIDTEIEREYRRIVSAIIRSVKPYLNERFKES